MEGVTGSIPVPPTIRRFAANAKRAARQRLEARAAGPKLNHQTNRMLEA